MGNLLLNIGLQKIHENFQVLSVKKKKKGLSASQTVRERLIEFPGHSSVICWSSDFAVLINYC